MNSSEDIHHVSTTRMILVGILVGSLLNVTGWLGNNLLLRSMWQQVGATLDEVPWRDSIWQDVCSFAPDFLYGVAIAWLCVAIRSNYTHFVSSSLSAGLLVALVGGVTTYFAIANSGFIPWNLAGASFALVLGTKLPLALLAGFMLESTGDRGAWGAGEIGR